MQKRKWFLFAVATVCALFLSGCGLEDNIRINDDFSSTMISSVYVSEQEEALIAGEMEEIYGSFAKMMKEMGYDYAGKAELNGAEQNLYQSKQKLSAKDTKKLFIVLNKNQAVFDISDISRMMEQNTEMAKEAGVEDIGYAAINVTYPFSVSKANGKLQKDGRTVQYSLKDLQKSERIYAVGSAKCAKIRTCTITGVKNKAAYRKNRTVRVKSEGVITSFRVNGVSQASNSYQAKLEGTYQVRIKTLAGGVKTLKFTIDKTKPVTNVRAKEYPGKVTLRFQDKISGIKSATLNGKKVKSGRVVSRKGTYVLKVSDKAGNVKKVTFSIK